MNRVILIALIAACGNKKADPKPDPQPTPKTPDAAVVATPDAAPTGIGIDLDGMNKAIAPGDDFFRYANGTWLDKTEIPADRVSYGTGPIVGERTQQRVVDLVKADQGKVGMYYATFMDEATIESKGTTPLQPTLDRIAKLATPADLATELGGMVRADVDATNNTNFHTTNLFGAWIAQDFREPTKYAVFLLQGGLGMPDRDYYVAENKRMTDMRTAYLSHAEKMLELAKIPDAKAAAKRAFDLEVAIAKVHVTRHESEDLKRGLVAWKRTELAAKAPGLEWDKFLAGAGLDKVDEFIAWHATAITGISALAKSEPLDAWKSYLTFRAIERASAYLPKAFVEEGFAFYGQTLSGAKELRARWKRGVDETSDAMGEAVGKLYVDKYFSQSEKDRATKMVKSILDAFGKRIDALAWMSPETKAKAKAKLAVLEVGVGYPDTWTDYGKLEIVAGDALGNAQRASLFDYQRKLAWLGHPVDRHEWVMTPHLVNAVNLPAMNAMNFPAGMLQPPYFDPSRPVVMDYGAIGAVIGHEISHSFDDQGALFDATGRLQNWWTPADFEHFKSSGAALSAQYSAYKPFADANVDGKLTLSENIADVAGLSAAYDAYRAANGGKEADKVGDLTGDQQFFLSFAQSWRQKIREPALRQRLLTDGHAPAEFRADTVRNNDAWYAAFGVTTGKLALDAKARVKVW